MKSWTSAKRSEPITVCPGDLFSLNGTTERAVGGFPPHIVFVPEFGHRAQDKVGGSEPSASTPVEYHVNLAPFWVPYRGQIHLDGGFGVTYTVAFTRSACQPRPHDDQAITLEDLDTTPVKLPLGVYAVQAVADCDLTFRHAGNIKTISLAAGQRVPLGQVAQGTVESASGVIPMTCFFVRY